MFQIDNSTAVAAMPAISAAGTPGWFSNGNPATGVPATILPAEFLNILQAELLSILVAAGVSPDKSALDQLLTALRSSGVFKTAALFDNSTKAATMSALQAAGLHFPQSNGIGIGSKTTLSAADAGKWFEAAVAGLTITMPALSTVPYGASFAFVATYDFTLKGNGAELISPVVASVGANTIQVRAGETIVVTSNGQALGWYVVLGGIAAAQTIGSADQSWQNVIGSRVIGTTYYNTTRRPIMVAAQGVSSAAAASMVINVNGIGVIGSGAAVANTGIASFAIVPPGGNYTVGVTAGTGTIQNWNELR